MTYLYRDYREKAGKEFSNTAECMCCNIIEEKPSWEINNLLHKENGKGSNYDEHVHTTKNIG